MSVVGGFVVPGRPHPLLAPQANPGYQELRDAFGAARERIAELRPDVLVLYSTQWHTVIGHQVQADPNPVWTLVDPEWHELGSMPYDLRVDADYAHEYVRCAKARGLHARSVAYRGFPVDTGTVVALQLLNPDNAVPACVVSCNMYADRAETLVLGKAAADALQAQGKRAVAVAVTALSNRLHTGLVPFDQDHISSEKDDEWNRKLLEVLSEGRLEDASQHAREFTAEANGDQKMKALWWLAALMGQHNNYEGEVHAYAPLYGSGAAVVGLAPSPRPAADLEFDEEDVEMFRGDRNVLAPQGDAPVVPTSAGAAATARAGVVHAEKAPRPVGAFPHARQVGELLFLSGMGPRTPGSDEIPGGPVRDADGNRQDYDVEAQTRAVIENIRTVLEASGSSLDQVVDVQCYLIDMDRDFETFNRVYAEYFADIEATRTTVAIEALPTPIAVEFKVVARATG